MYLHRAITEAEEILKRNKADEESEVRKGIFVFVFVLVFPTARRLPNVNTRNG